MEKLALFDIFTTQNDLYGKNNCPIQFCLEIYSNEDVWNREIFVENEPKRKIFKNIVPDERIMPLGSVISGIRDSDVRREGYAGEPLPVALESIYKILTVLREKDLFIGGFNHISYDLKILNDNFKRVLEKEPITFPKDRIIDIFKIMENTVEVSEIGSYSMDSVFMYLYDSLETLKNLRSEKGTGTDLKMTRMMLWKLMRDGETFTDFLKRTGPREDVGIFSFGKYKGARIEDILKTDQQYVLWVVKNKSMQEQNPNLIRSLNKILSGNVV